MGKTCEELRSQLRKVGRKVVGTKSELKQRLNDVLHTNDRGWIKHGESQCATIEYLNSGAHKHVYLNKYEKGPRKGQLCVRKVFKSGSVYKGKLFKPDIKVTDEAAQIIRQFLKVANGKRIYLNKPEVWTNTERDENGKRGCCLVEPYLEGTYHKFNSNSGYEDDDWKRMQALSHFSFEWSNGKMLLCDLQGVQRDGIYILTDPAICSIEQSFGPTDLGLKGIQNFFAYHKCNKYCRGSWRLPQSVQKHFPAVKGTTFALQSFGSAAAGA